MDGELGAHEAERTIGIVCGNAALKQKWHAYHLVGEVLRGEGSCAESSTQRIMDAIASEPTVLAPRKRAPASVGRIAFAAAASVVTVAVVGWIGLQDSGNPAGPTVAKSAPAGTASAPLVASNVVPFNKVNEYLVVHRQLPNAEFYRPVSNQASAGR
ncbi:MAG: sigma-E factor negative regulatory protein [Betaproteobacteria bacterium]|nr:sigma-E factor negative regulatory protein [Betaproteobacteria bacterium]